MTPYAIISTDWHISSDNVELSKSLAAQQIELAKERKVTKLICLGDVFESRKAQPENVLTCFHDILNMIEENSMHLYVIPGNHDKTDYKSVSSFLTPFANHPAISLIDESSSFRINNTSNVWLHFLPFFQDDIWVEKLNPIKDLIDANNKGKHYLFSHQSMNGSRNNDGSKVESRIDSELLSKFDMCYFGHYHDEQQPLINAIHLSSWKQKNFGEDDNKGFYVLNLINNEQLDIERVESNYPKYHTFELTTENAPGTLPTLVELKQGQGANVRVKVKGSTSELKALPLNLFTDAGIKVQTIDVEEINKIQETETIQDYEKPETLIDAFKEFCEEKRFDFKQGIEFLKKVL